MYYAIIIEIDNDMLTKLGINWVDAYIEMNSYMKSKGFDKRFNLYVNDRANSVNCVIAMQDLVRNVPWAKACIKEARLLRVEEDSNLRPAINYVKSKEKSR